MARTTDRRFGLARGSSLRRHAARGTLINGAFNAGVIGLSQLKGIVLVAFLAPEDFGIWGILLVSLGTLTWLKQVGISDKYIQQNEEDQELAFQRAFTLELAVNTILLGLLLVAVPVMALVYDRPELLAPGFALCLLLPALQLQTPFWVLYRRMEFARQRRLQLIDPLVATVATIGLAAGGAGYWSIIVGTLVGSWVGALVAWRSCPYPLRLRYDRGTLRTYASFSGPLFVASIGGIVVAQGSLLFGEDALGLAGAGAITLAAQISQIAQRVDDVLTQTLYPVICAVADRRAVLYETFTKSNRLALMWAMPLGIGLVLFAPDVVRGLLDPRWEDAIVAVQAAGLVAALSQLAFNWTSYLRALGRTRPIAVASIAQAAAFLLSVPLMYRYGLEGFAAMLGILCAVSLGVRAFYLARLFEGFALATHAVRALLPFVPAVGAVLLVRLADGGGPRTGGEALAEAALFAALTLAATWAFERDLLREAIGYLRRRGGGAPTPAAA